METGRAFADAWGRDLDSVQLMTPEAVEAGILPGLRPRLRDRLLILVNLAKVMTRRAAFPTDLEDISKARLKTALLSSLDYWGAQNG